MRGIIFFPIVFLTLFSFNSLHADSLKLLTEEMPPYNYSNENGEAVGFSVEIVEEMMRQTGLETTGGKIRVYTWARSYRIALSNKNVMLFLMVKSEKRKNLFKWVGPIAPRTIWFWKLAEREDIKIDSFEDIKKYRVGAVREFASTKYMMDLGFNLDLCNKEEINFRKLLAKRFDLLTALELAAAYQMNKQGQSFEQLERVAKLDDRYEYYLALNINTSDEIVNRLQNSLDKMKKDGTYDFIKKLYLK